MLAAGVLTLSMSLVLAAIAKGTALAFHVPGTISVLELGLVSILGGALASIPVLGATVVMAVGSVRYGWDLDDIVAPVVSTLGDVLTIPALWLASHLVGLSVVTNMLGTACLVLALAVLVWGWRAPGAVLREVVRQSYPVLLVAAGLSSMAGIVLEKRLETFQAFPALLVLVPAFVSSAGALGGILSGRLSTKLHLGVVTSSPFPDRLARRDGASVLLLGLPVYAFNALGAHVVARLLGQASPGLARMLEASLLGGAFATVFVVVVAYYSAIAAVRIGFDPDNYGIPVVTSSVDFLGAVALIAAAVAVGIVR